ncbi:leucine-rich repeats and immunoglobulin-like domains protein 1 [Battus philenor]|uniref:leucine-rich repeats and immunoglobulin-like domains protein 1 n=1 Tax=Battus philenor TaxID=42288 RepID=UPI0035D0A6D6
MINVNEDDQFYISEPFVSPNDTFKIAIVASDEMTDESVKRISPPIEPQVILEPIENKAPKVSIIGESRLMSSYGQTLLLKCSINGYPAPKTVWQDESGTLLTSKTAIKKIPYEFISVLEINNITTNNTFNCKASNDLGSDKKSVTVEVKTFFKVVDISKDKVVEYNKKGTLHCKVNASPPVNITWYQNGKEMKIDNDINFSPDNSTLIINKMKPKMAGKIICEIRNGMNRKIYNMKLSITGIDAPSVDKKLTQISVSKDASVNIPCR